MTACPAGEPPYVDLVSSRTRRRRARLASLLLPLCLTSCSHERTLPPDVDGVYGRIVEAREDYETALELILSGDDVSGENLLAAASTRLTVAMRECARTPGCDDGLRIASLQELAVKEDDAPRAASAGGADGAPAGDASEADLEPDDSETPADSTEIEPVSLLEGASLDDLVPLENRKVLAQLNVWLTWKRPDLVDAYRNYRFLRSEVAPAYEKAGLPEALLFAMMATESGAKVHAYSRAGAAGPLQFMPQTARRYGLGTIDGFDTRLDPERATRANARYLVDHLRRFRGNLELTLAAYNVGETRLRRIRRRHPGSSFWDPRVYYALPVETRLYVPRVMAAAVLFLHPEAYGLSFDDPEATSTSVKLLADASLGELAVCLGSPPGDDGWFRTMRNLNPDLSPSDRIPAGSRIELPTAVVGAYAERCAEGAPPMVLARKLHDADYPAKPEVVRYVVRAGDTLATIALEHRSSVREIAELNGIRPPSYVIHPGQALTVPARQ